MKTKTCLHLDHVAERCGETGPLGEWVRVLAGQVVDYGGNVLYEGTADQCVTQRELWRVPTRLRPTQTQSLRDYAAQHFPQLVDSIDWEAPVASADTTWGFTA